MNTTLVVIPTYNERESLPLVLKQLRATLAVDVLVVDDNSPDGTGEWAREFSTSNPWLNVMLREGKQGLATAYIAGFRWAELQGYTFVVEMDADGSHRVADLPRLLYRADAADRPAAVIGSRWIAGGKTRNWPLSRQLLSKFGNVYIKVMLSGFRGVRLGDATAGFRVYRLKELAESGVLETINSTGYSFQVEMTYRLLDQGLRIVEVPIIFEERQAGQSKMSPQIVVEEMALVTSWGIQRRIDKLVECTQR